MFVWNYLLHFASATLQKMSGTQATRVSCLNDIPLSTCWLISSSSCCEVWMLQGEYLLSTDRTACVDSGLCKCLGRSPCRCGTWPVWAWSVPSARCTARHTASAELSGTSPLFRSPVHSLPSLGYLYTVSYKTGVSFELFVLYFLTNNFN